MGDARPGQEEETEKTLSKRQATDRRIPTLLLTGTVGSGKTVVAVEIGRLLEEAGVASAVVDLDWLGWVHLPGGSVSPDELIVRNLTAIWGNLRATGIRRAILARAVLRRSTVDALRRAIPDGDVTVIRLTSPPEMIEDRLRRRDTGAILEGHLEDFRTMTGAMDEAGIEDLETRPRIGHFERAWPRFRMAGQDRTWSDMDAVEELRESGEPS
jgi:DNA polymerase III delta prime subunit